MPQPIGFNGAKAEDHFSKAKNIAMIGYINEDGKVLVSKDNGDLLGYKTAKGYSYAFEPDLDVYHNPMSIGKKAVEFSLKTTISYHCSRNEVDVSPISFVDSKETKNHEELEGQQVRFPFGIKKPMPQFDCYSDFARSMAELVNEASEKKTLVGEHVVCQNKEWEIVDVHNTSDFVMVVKLGRTESTPKVVGLNREGVELTGRGLNSSKNEPRKIKVADVVDSCYTNKDGKKIYEAIVDDIKEGTKVFVDFEGIDSVNTSFVNSAFIDLLDVVPPEHVKAHLDFKNTSPLMNEIFKGRFEFEIENNYS